MRRKKIDVIRVTVLSALLCGLAGCAESGGTSPASSENKDPVEVAAAELGVAIPGCATSGSGYVYASTGGTLTLTVDTDPLVLSTTGGKLSANGFVCAGTVGTVANSPLKTTDVAKIVIFGSANDNKVILDFLPGSFGTKILAANGGILVNFADNSAATVAAGAGADSLMIRAGSTAETYKFAKSTTTSDVYVEINGDKVADINVKPSAAGTLALAASMGGGADNVFANTPASAMDKFSAVTGLVVGPMALGVTAYGGIGDDHFTGGAGPDAFFGGDGNDTFNMDALADGADVYSGDLGTDTVDYSNRTAAVNVDLGPLSPSLFGTVDLATPSLYGASPGTLDAKTLAVAINNTRVETVFSAPASPEAALTAINMAANTALGTTSLVYATMSAQNKLVLTNPSGTATTPVQVQGTLAIATAAGAAADGILGLTAGGATVATPVVGTVDMSTLTWGGSATLNAKRLLLVLNGLYFTVTFTTPASIAAALTAINTAADTALGTTGGTYATEDATHHLTLTAGSVAIKDGALAKALTSAHTQLGLTPAVATATIADADDGLVDADLVTGGNQPEADDVRYSTENILSGSGDDVLIGNALKNSIKGGLGNDTISGGSNASCGATDGDTLFGEDGNDTFLSPMINCKAAYTGGAGDNVVDFSGRTQILTLKNDAAALDGEGSEAANIGADVLKMIGGFGADAITGGVGDDILVGGPGADALIGGTGNDTVDYSSAPSAVSVTLCFAAAFGSCGTADDGTTAGSGEGDQVYQIEQIIGSAFIDTLSGSTAPATIDVTIQGGLLGDTITGGAGNDTLWGDNGDDTIHGGPGDDNISGGLGIDVLDGGDGDGDICLSDSSDVAATRIACEL